MLKEQPFAPSLFLLGYLVEKGCSWNTANKAGTGGTKATDIILTKGFHQDEIKTFVKFSVKTQISARRASDRMLRSDCVLPPAFQLSRPHRPTFKACSQCFLVNLVTFEDAKYRCPDEKISSVPAATKHVEESLDTGGFQEEDVKVNMKIATDSKLAGKPDTGYYIFFVFNLCD